MNPEIKTPDETGNNQNNQGSAPFGQDVPGKPQGKTGKKIDPEEARADTEGIGQTA
jgi:hypothetical protein